MCSSSLEISCIKLYVKNRNDSPLIGKVVPNPYSLVQFSATHKVHLLTPYPRGVRGTKKKRRCAAVECKIHISTSSFFLKSQVSPRSSQSEGETNKKITR